MIIFITGASHTGKTLLAQKLMERHHVSCFSIDHLKMGLIRSGQTPLTPSDDWELEAYLWPIVLEMAKTVLENGQNLIIEGCYIPPDCLRYFDEKQRGEIRLFCLVMTKKYLKSHFDDVLAHANAIEKRLDDSQCSMDELLRDNKRYMEDYYGWEQVMIDDDYNADIRNACE